MSNMSWNDRELDERACGTSSIHDRIEQEREFREKCITGQVYEPPKQEKPMTLAELRTEVRKLVPYGCTTHVELSVWDFNHVTPEKNPDVKACVYASYRGENEGIEAATAEDALELFKRITLPKLGLSEVAAPADRLAAMDCDLATINAGEA